MRCLLVFLVWVARVLLIPKQVVIVRKAKGVLVKTITAIARIVSVSTVPASNNVFPKLLGLV